MTCPRAKVYTRHRNKLEKHKSDWAAAGEIKGGEGSFHSRLLSSHLDIEAEASVFIRSHLDQDQVIVRDYSVQLEEHKSSQISTLSNNSSERSDFNSGRSCKLNRFILFPVTRVQLQIHYNTDGYKCTTVHQNKVVHFSPTFLAFLAQTSLFKKCNQ